MKSGRKNSRFAFYLRHLLLAAVPGRVWRRQLADLLRRLPPGPAADIQARVDYCNKVATPFAADEIAEPYRFTLTKGRRNYYLDLHEYARYFDPRLKIRYRFGDKTFIPDQPTIVKARPIAGDNANSVLFKLDQVRHFVFAHDRRPFVDKRDLLVWRGNAGQAHRQRFLEQYFHHPLCDVGHAHKRRNDQPWAKGFLGIAEQLEYKYILSLEGNDVASNLKWILSSNSLCFMPRPRFESWFLEGWLVPGRHYVEIAADFSDLGAKLAHYSAHPAEALEIIRQAQAHAARFMDPEQERQVALRVLIKYFERSGQWPAPAG